MNKIHLTILDEVNIKFDGLPPEDILFLQHKTERYVKGYFNTVAFQKKVWNGKKSQLADDGSTYLYMLDILVTLLTQRGYRDDNIQIDDRRLSIPFLSNVKNITTDYLKSYGITLRDYQIDTINAVIVKLKGIVEIATAGGKTFVASSIAKVFDSYLRSITIVPNDNLGTAMLAAFKRIDLDAMFINKDVKARNREAAWKDHRHVIITYQTLNNNRTHLGDFGVVTQDEVHIMGDVMKGVWANDVANAPVRIGMTGTLPEDAQKREMICCRVGGDVIYGIESAQLALAGFISKSKINMVELKHSNEERDEWLKKKAWAELPWSWEIETKYLNTNKKRLETIAKFIQNVSTENTLILCSKEIGGRLAEMTGLPFIDGETDPEARIKLYEAFKDKKNVKLLATFGTSGTGISIDDVFCGVLIDAGKDSIRILQGIGRMLRLDTEGRHFVTIYDVWSSLKYSSRHRNQRVKLYKQRGIEYDADWKINKILP